MCVCVVCTCVTCVCVCALVRMDRVPVNDCVIGKDYVVCVLCVLLLARYI